MNPGRTFSQRSAKAPTSFLPLSAVDDVEGQVKEYERRPYAEVSKGYKAFIDGDVVFAKIDPAMQNGKSAVIGGTLDGVGFGSTEFHVLRPGGRVTPEWVHRYVRRRSFRRQAERHFKGAIRHQRVPEEFMNEAMIPVPPDLDLQRALLARAEAALGEIRRAMALLEEMRGGYGRVLDAALSEVFAGGEARWPNKERLGNLVTVLTARADPRGKAHRDLPHIGGDVIEAGTGRLLPHRTAAEDGIQSTNYLFEGNVVLYSKLRPNLRKAAVVDFRGLCSADIYPVAITDERLDREFLMWGLLSSQFTMYAVTEARKRARMPKINQAEFMRYELQFPDKPEQQRICKYLAQVREDFKAANDGLGKQAEAVEDIEQAVFESVYRGQL